MPKIAPRFPLEFAVEIKSERKTRSRSLKGVTENLSETGLGLVLDPSDELSSGITPKAVVRVTLQIDEERGSGRKVEFKAKLVWDVEGRLGLHIVDIQGEDRAFYTNMIMGYQSLCKGFAELQRAA